VNALQDPKIQLKAVIRSCQRHSHHIPLMVPKKVITPFLASSNPKVSKSYPEYLVMNDGGIIAPAMVTANTASQRKFPHKSQQGAPSKSPMKIPNKCSHQDFPNQWPTTIEV